MAQWKYGRFQASKMEKTSRFFELEISRYCNGGGCFSCQKQKKKYKNKSTNPSTGSCNSHYTFRSYQPSSSIHDARDLQELCLDLDIQTQLNFEISNGQQNSFTAETALVQRRVARSTGR